MNVYNISASENDYVLGHQTWFVYGVKTKAIKRYLLS